MSSSTGSSQINIGDDVYGSDGDKVGTVAEVQSSYIVVEKGFFFPTDYYIPTSAVANFDGDKVYLSVTKDEALNQEWDQLLVDTPGSDMTATSGGTSIGRPTTPTSEGDRLTGITPTGIG